MHLLAILATLFSCNIPLMCAAQASSLPKVLAMSMDMKDLVSNGLFYTGDLVEMVTTRGAKSLLKPEKYDQCIRDSTVGSKLDSLSVAGLSAADLGQKIANSIGGGLQTGGLFDVTVNKQSSEFADGSSINAFSSKVFFTETGSINLDTSRCLGSPDFLDPDFLRDLKSLSPKSIKQIPDFTSPEWQQYRAFLSKWGTAFTTGARKGGSLSFNIQTSKVST
jgi:hypothetical protein